MAKLWYDKHLKRWCTKVTRGGRSKKFYFGDDKREATKTFHQLMADLNSGKLKLFPDQGLLLADLAEAYLNFVHTNRSPKTFEQYQLFVSKFVSRNRNKTADEITPLDLEKAKQELIDAKRSPYTVNHMVKCVKAMFNWAVDMDLLPSHKLHKVKKVPRKPAKTRFLDNREINKLLNACPHTLREMVIVYLDTGMRLSELTSLTANDLDFRQRLITIWEHKTSQTAKEPKPRTIPMTKRVTEILKAREDIEGPLFKNEAGTPYDKDTLRRRFDRAKVKAGLDDVTIHTLRHTFGSRAVMAGIDLKTVSEMMGHSTTRTTELYAHLSKAHLRKAIEKFEKSGAC